MATEEDNFDIDIYGDGGEDYQQDELGEGGVKTEEPTASNTANPAAQSSPSTQLAPNGTHALPQAKAEEGTPQDGAQKIASTDNSSQNTVHLPKQAPQTQGLKRVDGADDRFVDPGATTALFLSDLHWWVTDDDIRGWANQSQCEDELEDITFSEHKVNGKSKGQAYVLFKSPQAATAAKHKIESFGDGQQYTKKFSVNYTNPFTNPFRTLPKDGPMRNTNTSRSNTTGMGNLPSQQTGFNNSGGGYRGNRGGGYNNRGGGGASYNRGGYQPPAAGGFQGGAMGGFQNAPMGAMPQYNSFQNRGGMMGGMRGNSMGMRGGRGGMGPGGMMGMPMGNMGMPTMGAQMGGMGMGMPQMGMQGMPSFPVNPSPPISGQYMPQTGSLGGLLPPTGPAGQSSTHGIAMSPGTGVEGVPTNAPTPPGSHANPVQYSTSALPYPATPPLPSVGMPANFLNSSTSQQSSALKRKLSITGQGGFQGNQAQYNPAFFQGQGGDGGWNPHGAKRTRQE